MFKRLQIKFPNLVPSWLAPILIHLSIAAVFLVWAKSLAPPDILHYQRQSYPADKTMQYIMVLILVLWGWKLTLVSLGVFGAIRGFIRKAKRYYWGWFLLVTSAFYGALVVWERDIITFLVLNSFYTLDSVPQGVV
jgi:hypothetical protein